MTYDQVRKLCEKWGGCPGIVQGIMEAWRADASVPTTEKAKAGPSLSDIFGDIFRGGAQC